MIHAPGGVLALNNLNGSRYGSTMNDGHYGEVDVSPESMEKLRCILGDVLGSMGCAFWEREPGTDDQRR